MTDRPILFSGPMVQALFDGRKAQTRRVLKPQPEQTMELSVVHNGEAIFRNGCHGLRQDIRVSFTAGDRLWVREDWRTESDYYDDLAPSEMGGEETILYNADADWSENKSVGRRRASMHMPRWASRLTLTVSSVRVERLQGITDPEAIIEGIESWKKDGRRWWRSYGEPEGTGYSGPGAPRRSFMKLWDSLNKKRGFGWNENPWVIVITFDTHKSNIDNMEMGARDA